MAGPGSWAGAMILAGEGRLLGSLALLPGFDDERSDPRKQLGRRSQLNAARAVTHFTPI